MNRRILAPAAITFLVAMAAPLQAQRTVGVGVDFTGYSFEDGLGASAAQLMLVPLAVRIPAGSMVFDLYSAWAQGRVEWSDVAYTLQGPVDTRVKLTYQAAPWALVSLGATLPTGNSTHDGEEAVVASVLSMDLLGFRESTWGTGLQVTSSVATATRAGPWGIGLAAAYAMNNEFEPSSDMELRYQPGNETRIRMGVDRNFGSSTFTAGATFMTFAQDQADGRNLFQAGNRLRFDASLAFRAGAGVWTVYAANLWREHGDLSLPFVNDAGGVIGDTTIVTASQNLMVAGVVGAVRVGSRTFRPQVDLKLQSRKETDGRDEGSGWIVAVGGDIPLRIFGSWDFFPRAQLIAGAVRDGAGGSHTVTGASLGATVRWGL